MTMTRILFVDDEQLILDGLRNVLRKQRDVWDMTFVNSGAEALERLATHPTDVVISDMRMPTMDGAELLQQVRQRYPATARIVLTGQASKDDLLRVLPVAQQVLTKPCDPAALRASIERVCKLQSLLGNPQLQALVGGLDRLPTFPKVYQQLCELMERDDVTVAQIARIVEHDAALSLKTLSMANAAYFGLAQPTTSVQIAVKQIGFALLRALALSTDIFGMLGAAALASPTLRQLPDRALMRAQLAREFVLDRARADEAFTAALLLDVGMVVLAHRETRYLQLLSAAEDAMRPVHEIEREQLGFTHAEVGAYLLGVWGLPATLVEVVAAHHAPALLEISDNPVVAAIHIADVFTDPLQQPGGQPLEGVAEPIRTRPQIDARLNEWLDMAREVQRLS